MMPQIENGPQYPAPGSKISGDPFCAVREQSSKRRKAICSPVGCVSEQGIVNGLLVQTLGLAVLSQIMVNFVFQTKILFSVTIIVVKHVEFRCHRILSLEILILISITWIFLNLPLAHQKMLFILFLAKNVKYNLLVWLLKHLELVQLHIVLP